MRCKETRKREQHTAPSTEKKLTQKCTKESEFRIFSIIIRIEIITKNEFSHFKSNNSKVKFFSPLLCPLLFSEQFPESPFEHDELPAGA